MKTTEQFIKEAEEIHNFDEKRFDYSRTTYTGAREKLRIFCLRCEDYFYQRPTDHISKKYGCPGCKKSKSERYCLSAFRSILEENGIKGEFRSASPTQVPWLAGLYLDGVIFKDKKVQGTWFPRFAMEYQGIQHYVYPNFFHKTREEFERQQENDRWKAKACKRKGIVLVIIPYTISYMNREGLREFIRKILLENKIIF